MPEIGETGPAAVDYDAADRHFERAIAADVLVLADVEINRVRALLARYDLRLVSVADGAPIPGSFWGDREAGVIADCVYARGDTPMHSLLHEACHLIVAPRERRAAIHTDASDSQAEEDAACYLQIVLADVLADVGATRIMADMDVWGYTFRLGSARAWFERDADDARAWLAERGILRTQASPAILTTSDAIEVSACTREVRPR